MNNLIWHLRYSYKFKKNLSYIIIASLFLYIFSLPTFSRQTTGVMSYIPYFFIIILGINVLIYTFLYNKKNIIFNAKFFLLPFFVFTAFISTAIFSKEFRGWLTLFLLMLTFFICYYSYFCFRNLRNILRIIIFALFCFCLFFIIYYRNDIVLWFNGKIIRIGSDFDNVNSIGGYMSIGLTCSLYLLFFANKKFDFLNIIFTIIFIFVGIITGSRTFIILAVVSLLLLLFFRFKRKKIILLIVFIFLGILFLILFSLPQLSFLKNQFINIINTIFNTGGTTDGSFATRFLWQKYGIELASKNLLIGYGYDGFSIYSGVGTYTHGNFAECLCNFGLLGTFSFYGAIILPFIYSLRKKDNFKYIIFTLTIYYLIGSGLMVFLVEKSFYVILSLAFYSINGFNSVSIYQSSSKYKKILKSNLNICFVLDSLGSGGAEKVVSTLSNKFCKDGHNVTILLCSSVTNESFYKIEDSINIISCLKSEKERKFKFKRINTLKQKILDINPDVVISFLPHVCIYTYFALKNTKIPLIVSERNDPNQYNFIYKLLLKRIFKKVDGCVFQTKEAMKCYGKKVINKSRIIYNPVLVDESCFPLKNQNKTKVIISVGRLTEQKNFPLLINSFTEFRKSFPNYELRIYGEGPEKDNLSKLICNNKQENYIFLKGNSKTWHQDEINASLFVITSKFEGMPNALAEAMVLGIPCISSDCPIGGPKELQSLDSNLTLFTNNNQKELVSKMIDKIRFPSNNLSNSLNLLSIDSVSKIWINFIKNIVNK